MGRNRDESKSIDPKSPHAFVERMNVPYNIPRSAGEQAAAHENWPV